MEEEDVLGGGWLPIRKRDFVKTALGVIGGFAAVSAFAWLVDSWKGWQEKERAGGEECYPLWQETKEKLNVMGEDHSKLSDAEAKNLDRKKLDGYLEARAAHAREFDSKARAWMDCLERQGKTRVAAQPKQVPRARGNL